MSILGFKIWYSDGHTEQGRTYADWVNCTNDNVQAVVTYEPTLAHPAYHLPTRVISNHENYFGLNENGELTAGESLADVNGHVKKGAAFHDLSKMDTAFNDYGVGFVVEEPGKADKDNQTPTVGGLKGS